MVRDVLRALAAGRPGVFVVVRDLAHQDRLYALLLATGHVEGADIFRIGRGHSVHLTAEAAAHTKLAYRVVLATVQHNTGYAVTLFDLMLVSVYPSSVATRTQLEGRIVRRGQRAPVVQIRTYHTGMLSHILERHATAESLEAVLRSVAPPRDGV
jgi:hypothetical protein